MKTKEPPCTERYARWCGRSVDKIIIYLLPDFDYDGHFIDNIADESMDIEKIVEVKMQIEELNKALATLTEEERDIITAIFFREESLRSIGERKNRSYQAIGKRRNKILEKLRKLLEGKI